MTDEGFLGIDLGGTETKAAVLTAEGTVLWTSDRETEAAAGRDAVLARVEDLVAEAERECPAPLHSAAIAVPAVIDVASGTVEFMTNFPRDWNGFALRPELERRTGLRLSMLNDVRAATVGEQAWGAGRPYRDFICIAIGTGIGGGLVLNGELYLGSRGAAGEIGHMTVEPDGPLCLCDNRGCMEAVASGPAMRRAAQERIEAGDRALAALAGSERPTPRQIAQAAHQGSKGACDVIAQAGRYIGIGLGSLICALNPEAVVVGGGVAGAGELLLGPMREEIARRTVVFPRERGRVEVIPSPLGGRAGALGAAAWSMRQAGVML